uniref:Uncharacterized protein n=1 Tax=Schistocephalus solidus TaxID=70667 RepID=A0A0X3PFZ9_SCHSO
MPRGPHDRLPLSVRELQQNEKLFGSIKAIYGPCIKRTAPLHSSYRTALLTAKSRIQESWAEHFRSVLNRPSTSSDAANDRLLSENKERPESSTFPTIKYLSRAKNYNGKAPGSDAIPT